MTADAKERNEIILVEVERLGGGFVWEPETFTITLMDVAVSEQDAMALLGLSGVELIAINITHISAPLLKSIARIAGLKSLVVTGRVVGDSEFRELESLGPVVKVIVN